MNTYARKYLVKDSNDNSTTITAWSKNQAKKQYRQKYRGFALRIVSVTEVGLVSSPPKILGRGE